MKPGPQGEGPEWQLAYWDPLGHLLRPCTCQLLSKLWKIVCGMGLWGLRDSPPKLPCASEPPQEGRTLSPAAWSHGFLSSRRQAGTCARMSERPAQQQTWNLPWTHLQPCGRAVNAHLPPAGSGCAGGRLAEVLRRVTGCPPASQPQSRAIGLPKPGADGGGRVRLRKGGLAHTH